MCDSILALVARLRLQARNRERSVLLVNTLLEWFLSLFANVLQALTWSRSAERWARRRDRHEHPKDRFH
ncbi:hypothetical protein TC41_3176 [Alicyclobacillus acidocaldarius subsp. acidocaldarius Tc-4-1]|uniref:Uncharacterized protein n=1 Tax=Alicyclobacillus acidocaldarius (strain Tc-4-1) TaxID=1048834 RepID=F8IDL4_ALIAT|nr:hypothetical protein TC41_3176 [Alicyclobacillus acidocaldarius subsp. acidocaldarius Tc-4-1]